MIGTDLDKNASTYEINGEVSLYVVYRKPRAGGKRRNVQTWSFQFQRNVLEYLSTEQCYVALVCRSGSLNKVTGTEVCFLTPEELSEVYGLDDLGSDNSRSITIQREKHKYLRVTSQRRRISKAIPGDALKTWDIGS